MRLEGRCNPQTSRRVRDRAAADLLGQLDRHRIDGFCEGLSQGDRAEIAIVVVLGPPALNLDRLIDDATVRREAGPQRTQVNEEFEQRPWLSPGLGRPVELAGQVVAASDHSAHGAIRRKGNQAGLVDRQAFSLAIEMVDDDGFGRGLQLRVQGCA